MIQDYKFCARMCLLIRLNLTRLDFIKSCGINVNIIIIIEIIEDQ